MSILSDFIQAYNQAPESEKEAFVNAIMPMVEKTHFFEEKVTEIVEKVLDNSFEGKLSHSDFHPIQRIFEIETFVGTDGFNSSENEEDEHKLSLAKRIQTLEDKIENVSFGTSESSAIEIKQKTKTGKRAVALIKALIDSGKDHLTRAQIRKVLSDKDNEELGDARITEDASNPRRDISNALDEAERICSKVRCDKGRYGRHERRLLKA